MIETDYGKEAYFKLEELMHRVKAIEEKQEGPSFKTLDLSFGIYIGQGAKKTLVFTATGEQNGKIEAQIPHLQSVKLNGENISATGGIINGNFGFLNGENTVEILFDASLSGWEDCPFTVSGFLDNRHIERHIYAVGENYYAYADGDYFAVYEIGNDIPKVNVYGVKKASAYYADGIITLVYKKNDGEALLDIYSEADGRSFYVVYDLDYSEFAIRAVDDKIYIYGIKGNYLWTGRLYLNGITARRNAGVRAKNLAVGDTPDTGGKLLVTDITGNACVLGLSSSDRVSIVSKKGVGRKANAVFSNDGIWFYREGAIYSLVENGGRFYENGPVCVADEAVVTPTGRKILLKDREIEII